MPTVEITEPAEHDIRSTYDWWSQHRSTEQANRWYNDIFKAIVTLRSMPLRCPSAPESDLHPTGLRQLLFGSGRHPTHRIIFTIDGDTVTILRVRHTSQGELEAGELPEHLG